VSSVGRTWELWAHRYESGELWHIGEHGWVKLHQLKDPIVPVLVEEILGDLYDPAVTHYGWQDANSNQPEMIQIRAGMDPSNPKRALMFLNMCFTYGLAVAIKHGEGSVVALRIKECEGSPQ